MDMFTIAASALLGASPVATGADAAAAAEPAAAAADDGPAGETDKQRIERLENMVAELSRRLDDRDRQEEAPGGQRQEEPAIGQGEAAAGGQRKPSNHNLELYGFAQFDAIQDF